MQKKHIVVLMGGLSSEHDVSISSGRQVMESLNRDLYDITPVTIGRDGLWHFPDAPPVSIYEAVPELKRLGTDCVFIALHGPFGEDGRLQGMLDLLGLPYTSSGCTASALAMDKLLCKTIVRDAGIRVADHMSVARKDWDADPEAVVAAVGQRLGFPCVMKPPCQGSSVGISIPSNAEAFRNAFSDVIQYGATVMVEQFVKGTEVTCAVLEADDSRGILALPVTEIRPVTSAYFDYEAKYTPGASLEITPAEIAPEVAAEVQAMAVRVHEAVGCGIWSRSDFMIGPDGPVWIEVNTIPGMTPTSLFPQGAAAVGISYPQFIQMLIEAAIARQARGRERL